MMIIKVNIITWRNETKICTSLDVITPYNDGRCTVSKISLGVGHTKVLIRVIDTKRPSLKPNPYYSYTILKVLEFHVFSWIMMS